MSNATVRINVLEKLVIGACRWLWRLIGLLDPKPIQEHFAGRVNIAGETINEVRSLPVEDASVHVCRINNNRMKIGAGFIAKRGEMVKIYNPNNGKFVFRYVQGAGELRLRFNDIGLDYDAKLALGIIVEGEVSLQVVKANAADREFYLMYQDFNVSSRQSRALGWYMVMGGALMAILNGSYWIVSELSKLLV